MDGKIKPKAVCYTIRMNKFFSQLGVAVAVAAGGWLVVALISFAQAPSVWQEPAVAPPGGNTPTPLNVGPAPQTKDAGLWLNLGGAPVGLLVDQGNVGIGNRAPASKLVVAGEGDFMNNRIRGVATPIDGLDAVNKDYVDAQSGGGGKPTITLYGVSATPTPWAQFTVAVNQTIKNCLFGTGDKCTIGAGLSAVPPAGAGLSCSSLTGNWSSVFAGYGPYACLYRQSGYRVPTNKSNLPYSAAKDDFWLLDPDQQPRTHFAIGPYGVTYSICGSLPYQVAQTDYTIMDWNDPNSTGLGAIAGILSACVPQSGALVCNTCLICQQQ